MSCVVFWNEYVKWQRGYQWKTEWVFVFEYMCMCETELYISFCVDLSCLFLHQMIFFLSQSQSPGSFRGFTRDQQTSSKADVSRFDFQIFTQGSNVLQALEVLAHGGNLKRSESGCLFFWQIKVSPTAQIRRFLSRTTAARTKEKRMWSLHE